MPPFSTEANGQSSESRERLAIFTPLNNLTLVNILNSKCSKVVTELKLPFGGHRKVLAFQNKLVFTVVIELNIILTQKVFT
ncbi:unnamed protein product [Hymenolepis diminuta]|uniref:Uncharacterized protein n=1 Tax=Hymenolepis diminuta TaxID=6216 RepID=A0A564YKF4_HYMDI|nr:unnamed protein product [Hymenolepis diminuta]